MKNLIPLLIITFSSPVIAQEYATINVNRVCADIVNIPYASDNFSDAEFEQWKSCVKYIKSYDGIK